MHYSQQHKFHIPVMGLAFTIDTPLKVAQYGISSVISIMEDRLIEMMRKQLAPLDPVKLDITDQSDLHAGHAGAQGGGHYQMTIVSPRFADKRTIERHRMVYDALADAMQRGIHALAITAYTPEEFNLLSR